MVRKQEVIGELMEAFTQVKKGWGKLTASWVDCGRRDEVISFVDCWHPKTGFPAKEFCRWLGISPSKLSVWRKRLGVPCSHSPFVRRGDCLIPPPRRRRSSPSIGSTTTMATGDAPA